MVLQGFCRERVEMRLAFPDTAPRMEVKKIVNLDTTVLCKP